MSDEIAIAAATGLYFCQYDSIQKAFQMQQEYQLADLIVTQVFEVSPNRFLCGVWGEAAAYLCVKGEKTAIKINCPSLEETQCTDLVEVPDFNAKSNPYLIMRNNKAINLIDTANMKIYRLALTPN